MIDYFLIVFSNLFIQILYFFVFKDYKTLLEHDQLRHELRRGKVLKGFREASDDINFAPTFKFADDYQYNTLRCPSYCDRILYSAKDESKLKCLKVLRNIEFFCKKKNIIIVIFDFNHYSTNQC